jgi:pimeloyl-ACP methyl ester carboxylesterase
MTASGNEHNIASGATSGSRDAGPTNWHELGRDQLLRLKDGRALSVRHYGDENGLPVAFFHGWPGTRYEACFGDGPASEAGVHLIGFDRPGFGRSDYKRKHTFGSWPDDVAEAMTLLGADRFAVVGVSGGGPFALACAARIPKRLFGVGVVSGGVPHDAPGIPEAFRKNLVIFKIGRYAPFLVRGLLWMMRRKLQKNPDDLREYLLPRVGASDKAILERDDVADALRADQLEAYAGGTKGPTHEALLLVKPWDFKPEDIPVEVHVWQGDADIQVSIESVRWLLTKIRNGVPHFIDGGGHYFIVDAFPEILAAVTADARK